LPPSTTANNGKPTGNSNAPPDQPPPIYVAHRKQQSGTGQRLFRDERVTLTGFAFSPLKHPNVELGSVIVTNLAQTVTYVEGLDYELRTTGATAEIARFAGTTSIPDRATVLVDYTTRTARGESVFMTDHIKWTNRLKLKKLPLDLYANVRSRDEDLKSGEDPGSLDQQRTVLAGAELRHKGLSAVAEHEERDQKLSPSSVANRARVGYRRMLRRGVRLSLGTRAERLDYLQADGFGLEKGEDSLETVGADANLTAKLGRKTLVRLRSDISKSRGREDRTTYGNSLSVEWAIGKLDASLDVRYNVLRQPGSDRDTLKLAFTIKRKF